MSKTYQELTPSEKKHYDRRVNNYLRDKAEFLIVKNGAGHSVTNVKTLKKYEVGSGVCTCKDFQYRCLPAGLQCKHQIAVAALQRKNDIAKNIQKYIDRW